MKNKRLIGLRGLTRGSGHWGKFPQILNSMDSSIDFELLEIPGNGTRCSESPPIQAAKAVAMIRERSRFVKGQMPFSILGISLGGMLALKWAELFPSEITKLFVVNSSLAQLSPFYKRLNVGQIPQMYKALQASDFIEREKMILNMTSNDLPSSLAQVPALASFSKQYPVSRSSFIRQLTMAARVRIAESLEVQLKIICSRGDQLVDSSCSKKISDFLDAELLIHPTAGHDLPLDDPEWLAKVVVKELSEKT